MTDRPPRLDDLVDTVPDTERDRLEHAHELLLHVGAPPELPPGLADAPPIPRTPVLPFPRRRRWTALGAVAAAAIVLLAIGYGIGNRNDVRAPVQTIAMSGAGQATGSIEVFARDNAGNWPMHLDAAGLTGPEQGTYELWLTRDGALADVCGSFSAADGSADVRFSVPYELARYDGWVVVPASSNVVVLGTEGSASQYRGPPA